MGVRLIRTAQSRRLLMVAAVGWSLSSLLPAQGLAAEGLDSTLQRFSRSVRVVIQKEGQSAVALGDFSGPPGMSQAGPGLRQALRSHLLREGVRIERSAQIGIKGEYVLHDAVSEGRAATVGAAVQAVRLLLKLTDRAGNVIGGLNVDEHVAAEQPADAETEVQLAMISDGQSTATITDEESLISLVQPTIEFDPQLAVRGRNAAIREALGMPSVDVQDQFRVRAATASAYGVEILVNDERCPIVIEGGQAYVELARGQEYQIRVINGAQHDAAVTVLIDGINVFSFSDQQDPKTGGSPFNHYLIERGGNGVVRGWFRNNNSADAFLVDDYSKSAAAELAPTPAVGSICVQFAAAWTAADGPPADEPARTRGRDATARGRGIEQATRAVRRVVGVTRSVITIRYSR